jgi:ectoine hydroxylase-related dioxygenase (phytanoyl-CoA dioxygenase family)
VLLGGKAKLFSSINFLMGSQQKSHSDSIHMTTFPLGGLLGVWIAMEDIGPDNGPLHYYPGSQKLPYYLNEDYDNAGNAWLLGEKGYQEYEKMMATKIKEHDIQKEVFYAKKGDLLIWHANLFHGGEPHLDKSKTRKSMVLHYYDENCVCYHEISQRPAFFE